MHKYGAKKTVVDGITFASKAEARRYAELKLLVRAGEISDLCMQPRYLLQKAFVDRAGRQIRAIEYVGDFEYRDHKTHCLVCEDVKGMKTAVYELKRKMFLKLYPNIEHREI